MEEIGFECGECGEVFAVEVDAATKHPANDEYAPCPACGAVANIFGVTVRREPVQS